MRDVLRGDVVSEMRYEQELYLDMQHSSNWLFATRVEMKGILDTVMADEYKEN